MEVGLVGAYGQLVPNRVSPGHKFEHEAARSQRLNMVGKLVQERQWNSACATHIHVQVRNAQL